MESAYEQMQERVHQGLGPQGFEVQADEGHKSNKPPTLGTGVGEVTSQEQVSQAIALHQQGRLGEAKEMYESILKVNPMHFDALHLLGIVAAQSKNPQLAADLMARAIDINPNEASP